MRYCSPALDVLYNIFTSADKSLRDKHFEELLDTYFESLSGMIRRLGGDPDKLFTYEDFRNELRKFGDYMLLFGPMIIRAKVADGSDLRDMDEYCDAFGRGEDIDLFKDFGDDTQAIYNKHINEGIEVLYGYGFVGQN